MNLGNIVERYIKIPQDYCFFLLGTHGTGLQSLLFFISKLEKNNRNIVPLPLHWTNKEVVPHLTNLLWKKKLLGFLPKSAWGITFEGSPKNLDWINKNLTKKVPAIVLIRDPIDALVSHINYYIGRDIFLYDRFVGIDSYCQDILCQTIQLDRTCGFKKNLEILEPKIAKKIYIDTKILLVNRQILQ